ncbi:MAG: hypothetical protein CMH54_09460 [Myxococcales bacterium]|nr:hypothetical protein [Myxococcales bacterium]
MSTAQETNVALAVEVTGLSHEYRRPDGSGSEEILRDLHLRVSSGEWVAIMGPSGSGKSTLLHILGTLLVPSSGSVQIEGTAVDSLRDDERARLRSSSIGFVFQDHQLLPQLTALENVMIPNLALAQSVAGAAIRERATALLTAVGLEDRLDHRPGMLSVGQCQRVAVARALTNRPSLLLLDEPTGALDQRTAASLLDLLAEIRGQESLSIVTVTHSLEVATKADRRLHLVHGGLREE